MRAVIQRCQKARVEVAQKIEGEIGRGLVVFLGVGQEDSEKDACYLAEKISGLRIFEDNQGKMNLSLQKNGGPALVVSQFTLYGDCRKGKRPGFSQAAVPDKAVPLYDYFCRQLEEKGIPVARGVFGAQMMVYVENDGPVTILLDSRKLF